MDASYEQDAASTSDSEQVLLVLCGLIGSGKSTFAKQLQQHFPDFIRCNQDELGSRQAVEQLAISSLQKGLSVCIDRTNVDQSQRRYWIEIAQMFPGTQVWALAFNTSKEVCAERLSGRVNHPTIKTHAEALEVLDRFAWQYRPPIYSEGFDRILVLADGARGYAKDDIANLLDHIRDEVPPTPDDFPPPDAPNRGQPGYRGGYRKLDYRHSGQAYQGYAGHNNGGHNGGPYDQSTGQVYRHPRANVSRTRAAPYYVGGHVPGNGVRSRGSTSRSSQEEDRQRHSPQSPQSAQGSSPEQMPVPQRSRDWVLRTQPQGGPPDTYERLPSELDTE
ncbi:P-loop containing nucleoside triphosphate hydrolase protein [Calocera viscosa TUFC12733]|uniref:p-loop containing nucleoside triphosphate hydrolase protein n=1 Tax=Calocera viscosa (strain TUFC12733) TaxID=1330018 RepID=A0A167SDF0_CALVF|nr:P-loop containing nucleoside triphosphate hydrolase protein [Calocera viscosa TUFC12733]